MVEITNPEGEYWNINGTDILTGEQASYEQTFSPLLKEDGYKTFDEILKKDNLAGVSVEVLDLFGSGYFIQDLSLVDGLVAVRLKDMDQYFIDLYQQAQQGTKLEGISRLYGKKLSLVKQFQEFEKRTVIEGDLFSENTWDKIEQTEQYKDARGFSLVVCRPWGPFDDVDKVNSDQDLFLQKYFKLFNNAYKFTRSGNGRIYTQVPTSIESTREYLYFEHVLKSTPGLEVTSRGTEAPWGGKVLKLVKGNDAPSNLLRPLAHSLRL